MSKNGLFLRRKTQLFDFVISSRARPRSKRADITGAYISDLDLCNDTSLTGAACSLMEQERKISWSHPKSDHQPFSNSNSLTIIKLSTINTCSNISPPTLHIHTIYLLCLLIDCMHETLTNFGNNFGVHCRVLLHPQQTTHAQSSCKLHSYSIYA
jgi:hypothetical protein